MTWAVTFRPNSTSHDEACDSAHDFVHMTWKPRKLSQKLVGCHDMKQHLQWTSKLLMLANMIELMQTTHRSLAVGEGQGDLATNGKELIKAWLRLGVTIHQLIFPFCPPLDHPVHSPQYCSLSL